jgi:hypothetical protein
MHSPDGHVLEYAHLRLLLFMSVTSSARGSEFRCGPLHYNRKQACKSKPTPWVHVRIKDVYPDMSKW